MKEKEIPKDLFDDLSKRIKNIASKMDLILFSVPKDREQKNELVEDVLTLQCFHLAVYRKPNNILDKFLERIATDKESTKKEKKDRKQTGSYFTPPYVAEYMVKSTLGPLVAKLKKGRKSIRPETKIRNLLRLKICDPAVGGGIFLVCAHDYLMEEALKINPNIDLDDISRKTAKCLFGVDINPEAVEGCKLALHLNIAKWSMKNKIEEFVKTAK